MEALGEPAMPWQHDTLAVQYELDEEATEEASSAAGCFQPRLWYRENDLTVPRQSGKTTKAKARHIHRMRNSKRYGWARRPLSFYMAQTATDARDKLVEEWMPALEESPYFIEASEGRGTEESEISQFLRSNGREAIKWSNGGRITVKPPSRTGGHGGSPDLIDLDEAFAHRDGTAEQGVRPGMITKASPQLYVVSTAGTADSEYLWGKVDAGRTRCQTGHFGRVSYFEWSAPEDEADYGNPDVWARCMPALGYTQPLDAVRAEFDAMKIDEFRRAFLNQWVATVARIIPTAAWVRCADVDATMTGRLWMAADASPGEHGARTGSIAIGGFTADGKVLGDVIENRPGIGWIPERIVELQRHNPTVELVYIDPTGPIGSVLPDIEATSLRNVELVDARTMASACGRYLEDVMDGTAVHIGQESLDSAVDGAARRQLADAWAWARRKSSSDISPLVCVTLTHWATVTHPEQIGRIL